MAKFIHNDIEEDDDVFDCEPDDDDAEDGFRATDGYTETSHESELEKTLLSEPIEVVDKKEVTTDLVRGEVVDMIIDNDQVVREMFRNKDFTMLVQNSAEEVKFSQLSGRIYCEIPSSACDVLTDDGDFRNLMYGINEVLKAIKDKNEVYDLDSIVNESFPQKLPFKATYNIKDEAPAPEPKEPSKSEEEGKGSGEAEKPSEETSGHGYGNEINMSIYDKEQKIKYENVDCALSDSNKASLGGSHFKGGKLAQSRIDEVNYLAAKLLKSFRGHDGKECSTNPSKRLKARKICEDNSDKIYVKKQFIGGKKIDNINFLVDMSGSMSGEPINNGVQILGVFNKLAKQKYVTGHIIYSDNKGYTTLELPVPDEQLYKLTNAGGSAEGLHKNMMANEQIIKDSKVLFCITDGCITDQPIDKNFTKKNHIQSIGVYVNDVEDIEKYTGSLNKWFDKSLVRRTVPELIDKICALALRG